ncbi:hypothetical protein CP556_03015 [Natrinema sp. CBA1119]|uniref:Uncharacterized protein n=1 Tax=Natrinema soli TaxID=1930624 RepID=A0ABD5SVB5_9EURY|nr:MULTISPECIES: hypothetical protein [Natrinema]PGF15194.1 hypothetical protein CP556_03015 [Natrinema sp. CBA1119]
MDLTIEDARVVVDYEGTDYAFEVVGDTELEYAETSAPEATVPDEVLEELEAQGYIVYRD